MTEIYGSSFADYIRKPSALKQAMVSSLAAKTQSLLPQSAELAKRVVL